MSIEDEIRKAAAEGRIGFATEITEEGFRPGLFRRLLGEVCGVDVDKAYVSTESSLTDFRGLTRETALAKIKTAFCADVSDVPGGLNVEAVLRRLELQ